MPSTEIAPFPQQRLRLIGASLVFLIPGCTILLLVSPLPWLVAICAWVMLSMGVLGLIKAMLMHTSHPALVISEKGIEYRPSPFGLVPWQEVVHVGIRNIGLVVAVADNKQYFSKLPLLQRCRWWSGLAMLPGDLIVIAPQSVNVPLSEVLKVIDEHMTAFERSQAHE